MSKVVIITSTQAIDLAGKKYNDDCYFNPIIDANNNWVVSQEEILASDLDWLKVLELIDYLPKQLSKG